MLIICFKYNLVQNEMKAMKCFEIFLSALDFCHPMVNGICDPNKSRALRHRSSKLGSKLKYLKINQRLL